MIDSKFAADPDVDRTDLKTPWADSNNFILLWENWKISEFPGNKT